MSQFNLFDESSPPLPASVGRSVVRVLASSQILASAQGFMDAYDFTLNPYVGCTFGCSYCYAAFFVGSAERRDSWGEWVEVKASAISQLRKKRNLQGKKIYMSSVTDPYQPIERNARITRNILEHFISEDIQPRLVIQTRSPLVLRDLDLLKQFKNLRVNVTVTTDDEEVRRRFEPSCPSNERRLETLSVLKEHGIKIGACISPMLPLKDPMAFAERLAGLKADVYVTQPFKASNSPFAASTRRMALDISREYSWTAASYQHALSALYARLPHLHEGKDGFMPE